MTTSPESSLTTLAPEVGAPSPSDAARREGPYGARVWLFPLTYGAHLCEEIWGGDGFPAWLAHVRGTPLPWRSFVVLNAIGFTIMCMAVLAIHRRPQLRQLLGVLGAIVCTNAILHVIGTVATHRYSPGLVTGTVLWLPLGSWALRGVVKRFGIAALGPAIIGGLAAHTAVSAAALLAGR